MLFVNWPQSALACRALIGLLHLLMLGFFLAAQGAIEGAAEVVLETAPETAPGTEIGTAAAAALTGLAYLAMIPCAILPLAWRARHIDRMARTKGRVA